MRRRAARTCIAIGGVTLLSSLALPVVVVTSALAAAEPGSGFSSFNLAANAPSMQVRYFDVNNCSARAAGTGGCEGVIPETVSTLRNGPIGFGLSSVVWPGVLAGNIGSVAQAANPQTPPEASMLNSPIRAEARTGSSADTVTNDDYPGVLMSATAKDDLVSAAADVAQSAVTPAGAFGNSASRTSVALTGTTKALARATSRVTDISLAGGQVTIGSVTSTVEGTTDGVKATAKGTTTVNDARIAGVPVTIDDRGITVQSQNNPANATAAAAVNTVVTNLGMTVALSQPAGKPEGGKIVYNAGSLVVNWAPDGGANNFLVVFGGASVALAAVPGGAGPDFAVGGDGIAPFTPSGGTSGTTGGGQVQDPITGGGSVDSPVLGDPGAPPSPDLAPAGGGDAPVLAGSGVPLPGPASPAYLIVGLFGAGLFLAGMRQLPDRVLEATASACLLGETR